MENYKLRYALLAGLIGMSYAAPNKVDENGNVFISGEDNLVDGKHNVFKGNKNRVKGNSNVIIGDGNVVKGGQNYIQGSNNFVMGGQNFVYGSGNKIQDSQSFTMGDNHIKGPHGSNQFFDIQDFKAKMQEQMEARFKELGSMMGRNFKKQMEKQI